MGEFKKPTHTDYTEEVKDYKRSQSNQDKAIKKAQKKHPGKFYKEGGVSARGKQSNYRANTSGGESNDYKVKGHSSDEMKKKIDKRKSEKSKKKKD